MPLFMKAWLQFEGPERRKKSSGFWPRWALSWPESGIAALATLVSGLGCLPRARRARQTQTRA